MDKWAIGSAEKLVDFLKEKAYFAPNNMQLIIPLENIPGRESFLVSPSADDEKGRLVYSKPFTPME
ncbi:MAG TPA: hypothetical protein VMR99_02035 [Candidatus Paceibacterota bacterium]|nr:hypothetical protein [Candidatus Paceibacterota bacterium]